MDQFDLVVIGGGLAGSEACWQAAERGIHVRLFEMRPKTATGAHKTANLAELICSNSLGSNLPNKSNGILLAELRAMHSLLIRIADQTAVPAGNALAVDRELFSEGITKELESHPNIEIIREECKVLPDHPCIIASGPLTSSDLVWELEKLVGKNSHFFYDAIAPIVEADSIDMNIAYRASRYADGDEESGDYINCPFTQEEYNQFIEELLYADRIGLHDFEQELDSGIPGEKANYFERCLPVEVLARRGIDALAYGPMRPTGLKDPKTDRWPYAVLQLRQDNAANTLYNLVGFQTNMTFKEQARILRMVPGLKDAAFVRYGQMHRNSYLLSPAFLNPTCQHRSRPQYFFAGQLIGVEGYAGNIASGLAAGINAARMLQGKELITFPVGTMLGGLMNYVATAEQRHFQPMKANFGLLPEMRLPRRISKTDKHLKMAKAARTCMSDFLERNQNEF